MRRAVVGTPPHRFGTHRGPVTAPTLVGSSGHRGDADPASSGRRCGDGSAGDRGVASSEKGHDTVVDRGEEVRTMPVAGMVRQPSVVGRGDALGVRVRVRPGRRRDRQRQHQCLGRQAPSRRRPEKSVRQRQRGLQVPVAVPGGDGRQVDGGRVGTQGARRIASSGHAGAGAEQPSTDPLLLEARPRIGRRTLETADLRIADGPRCQRLECDDALGRHGHRVAGLRLHGHRGAGRREDADHVGERRGRPVRQAVPQHHPRARNRGVPSHSSSSWPNGSATVPGIQLSPGTPHPFFLMAFFAARALRPTSTST